VDADGDFVVAWTSRDQDGSGLGIYARLYNSASVPVGGVFRVNTHTTHDQHSPSVAMEADGDFVVAWCSEFQDGSVAGIYARRFNATRVPKGPEFRVNTYTTDNQLAPSVAVDSDGDFVVAWQSSAQDGSSHGIYAQAYDATGVPQGSEFRVNTHTTNSQASASAAMDADGNFVVAWIGRRPDGYANAMYAQRYVALAERAGPVSGVAFDDLNGNGLRDGGEPGLGGVTVRIEADFGWGMETAGSVVTMPNGSYQFQDVPAGVPSRVAVDAPGGYVFTSTDVGDDDTRDSDVDLLGHSATYSHATNATIVGPDAGLVKAGSIGGIVFRDLDGDGVRDGDEVGLPGWVVYADLDNSASRDAGEPFAMTDLSGAYLLLNVRPVNPVIRLEAQSLWMQGQDRIVTLPVGATIVGVDFGNRTPIPDTLSQPSGPEFRVNTYTRNDQSYPSVAVDNEGNFVVVWQDGGFWGGQDGSLRGIYAQRYSAAGTPQGTEFRVNTRTGADQDNPSIAVSDDGDFVVVWRSNYQDGSGSGIYAQRYSSTGVPQGGEFRVNTYTTNQQASPSVAMNSDGDFVVAWESYGQDGSFTGIYAQRYNAAGVQQGIEFRVNTYTTNQQASPSVAMDSDGDFVVVWQSSGPDVEGHGIFAQRYNSAGLPQGGEFRVGAYVQGYKRTPTVAMDGDGGFIVAWTNSPAGLSAYGELIYVQRYSPAGVPQGVEFKVNQYNSVYESSPTVTIGEHGGFVVAWRSSRGSMYAHRFNSAGVPQGGEFPINTHGTSPAVAMDSNGDFVMAYMSYGLDGSGWGVYAQRYEINQIILPAGNHTLSPAQLGSNRIVRFLPGAQATLEDSSIVGRLLIEPGATLDLATHGLIVDWTGTDPLSTIAGYLTDGFNAGGWDGPGLTSSSIAEAGYVTALGYGSNADLGFVEFNGTPIDDTTILVKYTWTGDANLDGIINADDYANLDLGAAGLLVGWVGGDFNFDGLINADDFAAIDIGAAAQSGPLAVIAPTERVQSADRSTSAAAQDSDRIVAGRANFIGAFPFATGEGNADEDGTPATPAGITADLLLAPAV
jgi:hypothetical protein